VGHTWTDVVGWLQHRPSAYPHGAYAWGLALWTRLCGRTPWAFAVVDGVWAAVLAGGLAALAERARPRGAVWGVAALVMPLFPTMAHTHWVHHAEATLAVLTLLVAEVAPTSVIGGLGLGLLAGFGASVRPSALVWVLPAVLPWLARADRSRWWAVIPGLFLASGSLAAAAGYAMTRWSLRADNAAAVGDVWRLWPVIVGWVPLLVTLAMAARGGVSATRSAIGRVAWFWAAGGVAVVAVTRAGPDNVPTAVVGAVLLAAHAELSGRARAAVCAALLVGPVTLVPALDSLSALSGWSSRDEPLNWLVPRSDGVRVAQLAAARDAVCGDRPCRVVLASGLVHPSWEDDGTLGLYLGGVDRLAAVPVRFARGRFDGAVDRACVGETPDATRRFPGLEDRFRAYLGGAEPVATVTGNGCTWTWYRLAAR
jgi:hypothetical protein